MRGSTSTATTRVRRKRSSLAKVSSVSILAATLIVIPAQARAATSPSQCDRITGNAVPAVRDHHGEHPGRQRHEPVPPQPGRIIAHPVVHRHQLHRHVPHGHAGRQYDSALGTPASVTVGRDQQSGAVTSIHLDGIPLTASPLVGSNAVGQKPNSVAFSPDGATAYVTNYGSGSVSPVPASVPSYSTSPAADWIWNTPGSAAGGGAAAGTIYLRKTFSTPTGVTQASLRINADDAEIAYVNGVQVASSTFPNWPTSQYVDITKDLNPAGQQNVIAVAATNGSVSPSGVIAAVQIDGSSPQRIITDASWKAWPASTANPPVSATPPARDWNTVGYDDSAWENAFSAGAYGTAPWGTLGDTVAPISVGGNPSGIVVAPDGDLLVANYSKNELQEVDPSSRSVARTIPVGVSPEWPAITPDGKTVLVPNTGSNTVTAVDVVSGTSRRRFRWEPSRPISPSQLGVAALTSPTLRLTRSPRSTSRLSKPLPDIPVGSGPIAATATPDGQNIVISLNKVGAVVVLDVAYRPGLRSGQRWWQPLRHRHQPRRDDRLRQRLAGQGGAG